mmetsp:Transcript_45286/g.105066  ORF Transcript_45286/g.105066 Transcript_45286/m.105066 type:complete len:775 (-) Transcript_45286:33-2357(-)
MRVAADAYCLICKLIGALQCDKLLYSFAREQLMHEEDRAEELLRVEVEAHAREKVQDGEGEAPGQLPSTARHLDQALVGALDGPSFCEAFHAEAGSVLKWGLLLFLVKRNKDLCEELVKSGLVQTLLTSVVDSKHPVRQNAALMELQHLRVISPGANAIAESILEKPELLSAVTLEQFNRAATPGTMQKVRYKLRNVQVDSGQNMTRKSTCKSFASAKELDIKQEMIEHEMASVLDLKPHATQVSLFLTEAATKDSQQSAGHGEDVASAYTMPLLNLDVEISPFHAALSSLLFDPLEINADEDSPLIQEIRGIEHYVGTGALGAATIAATLFRQSPKSPKPDSRGVKRIARKPSHRPTREHTRAIALGGGRPHPQQRLLALTGLRTARPGSRAISEVTEVSLRIGHPFEPESDRSCHARTLEQESVAPGEVAMEGGKASQLLSLEDTTVGFDPSRSEFSQPPSAPAQSKDQVSMGPAEHQASCASVGSSLDLGSLERSREDVRDDGSTSSGVERDCVACLPAYAIQHEEVTLRAQTSCLAVLEVSRKHQNAEHADGLAAMRKKILHVMPPPSYHDYMAVDATEKELDRVEVSKDALRVLNPATQGRMNDLAGMGGFPRKATLRKSTPTVASELYAPPLTNPLERKLQQSKLPTSYPSGSLSARTPRRTSPGDGKDHCTRPQPHPLESNLLVTAPPTTQAAEATGDSAARARNRALLGQTGLIVTLGPSWRSCRGSKPLQSFPSAQPSFRRPLDDSHPLRGLFPASGQRLAKAAA